MSYDATIEYFSLPVNDNEMENAVKRMNLVNVLWDEDNYYFVREEIRILAQLDRALYSPRYAKLISDIRRKITQDENAIEMGVKGITKEDIEFIIPILYYISSINVFINIYYEYEFDEYGEYTSDHYNDRHDAWEGLAFALSMVASVERSTEITLHGEGYETYGARVGKDKDGVSYIEWIERVHIIYSKPTYYIIDGFSIDERKEGQ